MFTRTKGDSTNRKGLQTRGVTQGSPLSPTLYNLYMDSYRQYLRGHADGERKSWSTDLFADEVKLQSTNPKKLQELLNVSSDWEDEIGMTWAAQKCSMITPKEETRKQVFSISKTNIRIENETEYVGVSISSKRITNSRNLVRIWKAKTMAHLLNQTKLNIKPMTPRTTLKEINQRKIIQE